MAAPGPQEESAMQLFAMIGTAAFVLVGTATGARLLLLARRTRRAPELLLGCSLFAYAAVGQPLVVVSPALGERFGSDARFAGVLVGLAAIALSVTSSYLFNRSVFRPDAGWARVAGWLGGSLAIGAALLILASLPERAGNPTPGVKAGVALLSIDFALCNLWSAFESLRYYGLMRRRRALGLADPIVTNRFLLWGVGTSTIGLVSFATIACAAAGQSPAVHPVPLLLTALSGCVASCSFYLAFFPPGGYRRYLTQDTAMAGVSA
jgi:hypothetical protein